LPKEIDIESIKKHDNIKSAKEDLDELEKSCIYVVNTHKNFDNITYWALGYVMGKKIAIIGYDDGKNIKKIPSDVEGLISISKGIDRFMTKINRALSELKPKEYPMDVEDVEWDKQQGLSKNDPEAHDGS
jgi:nucleoside 2-deoxyribosyltransferase